MLDSLNGLNSLNRAVSLADQVSVAIPDVASNASYSLKRTKRTFDVLVAVVLILLTVPVMLIVALLVRCDGGTALFRHRRIGRDGVPFMCLKFRSMQPNAEAVLRQVLENDAQARAEWERDFKLRRDPRITRIGGMLRKTSLDELPQLFNVLRGEMSMVGPRPIVEAEVARYGAGIAHYIRCRPGITGLWQVSGRNDTSYAGRVRMDVEYTRTASLGGDIAIMARTVGTMMSGKGAY